MRIGIVGNTGSGKTVFTKKLFQNLKNSYKRIIIVDDLHQFYEFDYSTDIKTFVDSINGKKKFVERVSFENFSDYDKLFFVIWSFIPNSLVIIDELALFCDSYNVSNNLRNIFQRGRPRGISVIWNTQRLANVNVNLVSQVDFLISFQSRDILQFSRYFGLSISQVKKLVTVERYKPYLIIGDQQSFYQKTKILLDILT